MNIKTILEVGATAPTYATEGSAGADLYALVDLPVILEPGEVRVIGTGLRVAIPSGYEMQIRSRSGLAAKHGVFVANSPGTIDSDYRGEIGVILKNGGEKPFKVETGDRIAQAVFAKCERAVFVAAEELDETARGEGGYGHTGK